jgi:hypothetical protein
VEDRDARRAARERRSPLRYPAPATRRRSRIGARARAACASGAVDATAEQCASRCGRAPASGRVPLPRVPQGDRGGVDGVRRLAAVGVHSRRRGERVPRAQLLRARRLATVSLNPHQVQVLLGARRRAERPVSDARRLDPAPRALAAPARGGRTSLRRSTVEGRVQRPPAVRRGARVGQAQLISPLRVHLARRNWAGATGREQC